MKAKNKSSRKYFCVQRTTNPNPNPDSNLKPNANGNDDNFTV
jgi:hypothetical protein